MWRSAAVLSVGIVTIALAGQAGVAAEHARPGNAARPLAILVDTSQAMQPHVQDVRAALRGFVQQMQATHEITLVEFGERPTVLTEYTTDPVRLQRGVERVFARTGSGAYALDAIVEAAKGLRNREGTDPAIVVITAEGPEFSDRYHRDVVDELKTTGATLHALVLSSRNLSPRDTGAREREFALALGAERTGGTRQHLLSSLAIDSRLRELATRLK